MVHILAFNVKSKYYSGEIELVEVDTLGYDIYIPDQDDPINLGEIVYFCNVPTKKDVEKWLKNKITFPELKK